MMRRPRWLLALGGAALMASACPSLSAAHDQSAADAQAITDAARQRETMNATGRKLLIGEYPAAFRNLMRNDGFGGPSSPMIANRMQDRSPDLVAEARSKMTVTNYGTEKGHGLWHIRFPYVNVTLVEAPKGMTTGRMM